MIRGFACLTLLVGAVSPLAAQSPSLPKKLVVAPAALPSPALKYQLLPDLRDTTPGNGALFYERALSPDWWSAASRQKIFQNETIDRWLALPLDKLARPETAFIMNLAALREVDLAARHEYCNWELTDRLKAEGINLMLPDIQGFRSYATLLAVRSRLEMADGKLDKCVYTLQTGFKLGRDVANAPTLIQALVGTAVAQHMTDRVEELIQRPNAPNLYWALATLPEPFIDLREAFQGERLFLPSTFGALKSLETTVWDAQQQQAILRRVDEVRRLAGGWGFNVPSGLDLKLASVGMVIKAYPDAKRFLLASGRSAREVEAMPALQVALIYWVHNFERFQDDYYKWVALPYWQARPGLQKSDQELRAAIARFEGFPLLAFLPAVDKIYEARVRLDRRLAAMRCIEAVRLYAAVHDGKLPASLSDITEVPVPIDPVTGRSFDYSVAGERVTLRESGLADGHPVFPVYPLLYEVTFKH